jgi:3-phenylpropionate/trans-cinnamate dioxygenase ferredoxin reductase component
MTGEAAIAGIREGDADGPITMLSAEPFPPYNRPPLSKALWKGDARESVWRQTAPAGLTLRLGVVAAAVDPLAKRVTDQAGFTYAYDRLLLATGGTPRRLTGPDEGVIYFRTLADYDRLRALADVGSRFVVIGGGFIGTEIAAALAINGKAVTLVFPEAHIGARMFPQPLAEFLDTYYRSKGVEVLAGDAVAAVRQQGAAFSVATASGKVLTADGVVAGLGIEPNVELARGAGLTLGNGIEVDEFLRTSAPGVFAAGDVANFISPALGRRIRVEHEDNANTMGRLAGRNMSGREEPYHHLPFFYSDLFDLGYEAIGDLDGRLATIEDWQDRFRKGVVYYLRDGRVCGVLLWNTWGQVAGARDVIAQTKPQDSKNLIGRLRD